MKVFRYSRWDGSQDEFSLDADEALRAASDLMMQGLTLREALEWMTQYGFDLDGMQFRVMGAQELQEELRDEIENLQAQYDLSNAMDDMAQRLDDILDREQKALTDREGFESAAMNDFLAKRHSETKDVSERIEHLRDHEFADSEAGEDFAELVAELDRMKKLEDFLRQQGQRFHGNDQADYETAQDIRERFESLQRFLEQLASGKLDEIDPERLRELLDDDAARSLVFLRDFEQTLRDRGYLRNRNGAQELTPRAIRRIGAQALADVYGALQKGRQGEHDTQQRGAALPRPDETRPYRFGDTLDLDVVKSLLNGVRRSAANPEPSAGPGIRLHVDDLEVRELDHATQTTTVLLLDLSWSMSFGGRFPAAKRVALAMEHMVRTCYPRDRFFVVGFSTKARELSFRDLPEIAWDMGDPFTNLQAGLMIAERLIAEHPCQTPQILVVTDGQPTAYYVGQELHAEWPMGPGGVSPRAVAETMKAVRRVTKRGITINTFMLDDAPELVGFVEHMTEVNKGRAFFTGPEQLGSFLMVDYVKRQRRRR